MTSLCRCAHRKNSVAYSAILFTSSASQRSVPSIGPLQSSMWYWCVPKYIPSSGVPGKVDLSLLAQSDKPKLHVSYVALPLFREVAVDAKTMTKVRTAIEEAGAAHDRSLEEFRRQMDELRRSRAGEKAPPPNTSLERTRER